MENLTLTVTLDEVNLLLESLSRLEWRVSNPLILNLQKQAQTQLVNAAMPQAETPVDETPKEPAHVGL